MTNRADVYSRCRSCGHFQRDHRALTGPHDADGWYERGECEVDGCGCDEFIEEEEEE